MLLVCLAICQNMLKTCRDRVLKPIGSSSYSPLSGQLNAIKWCISMYFHGTKPCIDLFDLSLQTGTRHHVKNQALKHWRQGYQRPGVFNPRSLKYGPDMAGSGWLNPKQLRIWRGVG